MKCIHSPGIHWFQRQWCIHPRPRRPDLRQLVQWSPENGPCKKYIKVLAITVRNELWQGNILTGVCHSVHSRGVCLSACWDTPTRADTPGQVPPGSHTPRQLHPPRQVHPQAGTTPEARPAPRRSLQWTVRILLECFLVFHLIFFRIVRKRYAKNIVCGGSRRDTSF